MIPKIMVASTVRVPKVALFFENEWAFCASKRSREGIVIPTCHGIKKSRLSIAGNY
jgi:hypothetical protein